MMAGHGRVRPDSAAGCPETLDLAFLRFTYRYNGERRGEDLALVKGFGSRTIIVRGRSTALRLVDEVRGGLALPPKSATNPCNDTRGPHG